MALKIDYGELDKFCLQLFRLLDMLGLLPQDRISSAGKFYPWHRAKPNEFEKYPRLLFGSVQRYKNVAAGFKEWESRVLRDTPYRKEEHYLDLETLKQFMMKQENIFTDKVNMQHLRTSLYARVFQYLYPRRVLANVYIVKCQQNRQTDALGLQMLDELFPQFIQTEVEKLRSTYSSEWDSVVADARADLLLNAEYYSRRLKEKLEEELPEQSETPVEPEEPEEAQA